MQAYQEEDVKKMALTEADEPGGHSIGTMTPLPLGKLIRDRNASFASELRARENDALRVYVWPD